MTDVLDLAAEIRDAEVVDLTDADDEGAIPWHGVLAPEGVWSGDKRRFSIGSLSNRDLPLPLSWQKVNAEGHDGSVVIGSIDRIWKDERNLTWGEGMLLDTVEANEYIGLNASGASRGISVDVDSATMQMVDMEGNVLSGEDGFSEDAGMDVTAGRISGATACAIPAFQEAFIRLGRYEDATYESLVASGECLPCQFKAGIDEGSWDGSASNYTDEQWYDATIVHLGEGDDRLVKSNNKLPIYTPGGKLSRAGVHSAVGRLGQTDAPPEKISAAKATLRGAYDVLDEEAPDSIKAAEADVLEFGEFGEFVKTEDGPGWLTHPVDTNRLRTYWTKGKGALKIRWGVPGDFNRCRQHLAKYIKPQYLNGYCANRHYDALGFWPGRPVSADTVPFSDDEQPETDIVAGPSLRLVASAFDTLPPKEWFEDPHLVEGSAIVVTEEGRVFGHLAEWSRCHIGFDQSSCTLAPESPSDYAFFNTAYVQTDDGPVSVGHITYNTGHAGGRLNASAAVAHYDNTGTVIADVHAGRDQYGVWVAGWMRPGTGAEERYILRASTLSGDWRSVGTNLELVAALAVNVGGFPIPRTEMVAAGGRQVSLVAAGVVPPQLDEKDEEWSFDPKTFAEQVSHHLRDIEVRRGKMKSLRVSTGRDPKTKMAALAAERG